MPRFPRFKTVLRYGLPLVLWIALIFSASHDPDSVARTSRFLVPFLKWLNPDLSEETIALIRLGVRKVAHLTEFAVLGWLGWRVLRRPVWRDPRPWSWRPAAAAIGLAAAYAVIDEIHQAFVPNRQASAVDVVIDTAGASLGVLAVWVAFRLARAWRARRLTFRGIANLR